MDELILTLLHVSSTKPICCCSSHAVAAVKQKRKKTACEKLHPPDETGHGCESTFDNLTSAMSAAGIWGRKSLGGGVKSSYLDCAGARSEAAAGIWIRTAARGGAGLSKDDWVYVGQKEQPAQDERGNTQQPL